MERGYYIYMLILQALFRFNTSKSIRIFMFVNIYINNLFLYVYSIALNTSMDLGFQCKGRFAQLNR